jgi:hypothetical protein
MLKERAKRKNVPFDITYDYLLSIFPLDCTCPALGTLFSFFGEHGAQPTVDRIIPKEGYVVGNIVWVSFMANMVMSYAEPDDIIKVGQFAKKVYEEFYPKLNGEKNEN